MQRTAAREGRVEVSLLVSSSGDVASVRVDRAEGADAAFNACVRTGLARLRFPRVSDGASTRVKVAWQLQRAP